MTPSSVFYPVMMSEELSSTNDENSSSNIVNSGELKLRTSTTPRDKIKTPSWKLHLFDLVMNAPKAIPVHCIDPTKIFRLSESNNTLHLSLSTLTLTTDTGEETDEPAEVDPQLSSSVESDSNSKFYLKLPSRQLKIPQRTPSERELMVSRIRSLRLDIGDLSIAENLEKLCDHYFKLDKNGTLQPLKQPPPLPQFHADFRKAFPQMQTPGFSRSSTESPMTPPDIGTDLQLDFEGMATQRKNKSVKRANPYWANISLAQSPLFHGLLTRRQTEALLQNEGQFLVRHLIHEAGFILSFNFNGSIYNFRVIEEGGLFYLEDRKSCYTSLEEMVSDGLRSMYLELKAGAYVDIMTELAHINKHDSMISWLSPPHSGASSRKGSAVIYSRQVSLLSAINGDSSDLDEELNEHWFGPGLAHRSKKAICEICHLKQKGSFSFKPSPGGMKNMLLCRDCGLTVHEDCLIKVDSHCNPQLSRLPEIFGSDLTRVVKAVDKSKPSFVVVKCIEEIERRGGLGSEGIYRVSGVQDVVQSLQLRFETDRETTCLESVPDVNAICGVLKLYLRLLPEPLITKDVFEQFFMSKIESQPLSVDSVRLGLRGLPPAHAITLKYILHHLDKVVQLKESNKMSSYNLSSVLVPSFIVPQEMSLNVLKWGTDLLDLLIRNVHLIYQ